MKKVIIEASASSSVAGWRGSIRFCARGIMPMNDVLSEAQAALARLSAVCESLPGASADAPSPAPFALACCVRREAVLSAQVEGARFSLSDLLRHEASETGRVPDDVAAGIAHADALEHGLERLHEGAPFDARLVREVCARLSPSQPAKARLADLEPLLRDATMPALTKAASVHAQCAAVRPFARAGHRIARLLVMMILHHDKPSRQPLLCLSLHFARNRRRYHELLGDAQSAAGRDNWLAFFAAGVCETATGTAARARKLADLIERDRAHIGAAGVPRSVNTAHAAFCRRPIMTTRALTKATGSSYPTAQRALQRLSEQCMVHPLDAEQRNRRAFVYTEYLNLLNEDTDNPG